MQFKCLKAAKPLGRVNIPLSTKFPGVPGTLCQYFQYSVEEHYVRKYLMIERITVSPEVPSPPVKMSLPPSEN